MIYLALIALALSAIAILALCIADPKRRRAMGDSRTGMTPNQRRTLVAVACLPGFGCVLIGDAAAFFMWLGGCALIGWALAVWFRRDPLGG